MRLEQLHYLVSIINHHSINAAANALHMTQQSLSNSMQLLEQELQIQILERTHRGVHLTPNGEIVYQTAQQILLLWQNMQQQFSVDMKLSFSIPLKIVASKRVIDNLLLKPLNTYQRTYPDSSIICEDESYSSIVSGDIDFSYYDLIFTTFYFQNKKFFNKDLPANTAFMPLIEHKLLLVAHKDSDIAALKYISSSRLNELPIRCYDIINPETREGYEPLIQFYRQLKISSKNMFYSNSIAFCIQGVLDNLFYLLCSEGSEAQLFVHPDVVFIPIRTRFKIMTGYLLPESQTLTPAAEKFIEIFQSVYNQ